MQNRVPKRLPVPGFIPVPRRHNRVDGWTAERQRAFLDALAETGSVKHAAQRVNMAPEGAYALRRAPGAESFAKAWEAALDHGVQTLVDLAIDRAKDGVVVPVYSYGKLVGQRTVYNDRLLTFCIKHGLGRAGLDPSPLARGTRTPEAAAREEQKREQQWLEKHRRALAETFAAEAEGLKAIAKALGICLLREAEARAAGDFAEEDRRAEESTRLRYTLGNGPGRWAADFAAIQARVRQEMALPQQQQAGHGSGAWLMCGPTLGERQKAREEAQRLITEGRALWKAATDEASWKEWLTRGGAAGVGPVVEAEPGVEADPGAPAGGPVVRTWE